MEPINILWKMPPRGRVKINVHSFFSDVPLPNGNVSGIGIVIRNHRGKILRMVAGTLGINDQRLNELYALLEGFKRAYLDDKFDVIIESDHDDSIWEWRLADVNGVVPVRRYVLQQLEQRKTDANFRIVEKIIDANANNIAAYLARYGAENYNRMVILAGPMGRVFELWSNDMGLGVEGAGLIQLDDEEMLMQEML